MSEKPRHFWIAFASAGRFCPCAPLLDLQKPCREVLRCGAENREVVGRGGDLLRQVHSRQGGTRLVGSLRIEWRRA